jgi:peptidoglycan/xylan/chitin deacetylase (PgdA/CDA1 family)
MAMRIVKDLIKRLIGRVVPKRILAWRGPETAGGVALTFDDGPEPEGTERILEILRRHRCRATFFLVGQKARSRPELVLRMREEGHEIGSHGDTHRVLTEIAREEWVREIVTAETTLESLTGRPAVLFRPAKGCFNLSILGHQIRRRRTTVLWSVDPQDFGATDDEQLRRRLAAAPIRGGDILLLHDRVEATARVLPELIERIRRQGLDVCTVSRLLDSGG